MSFVDRYEAQLLAAAAETRSARATPTRLMALVAVLVVALALPLFLLFGIRDGSVRSTATASAFARIARAAETHRAAAPTSGFAYRLIHIIALVPAVDPGRYPHVVVKVAQTQEMWSSDNKAGRSIESRQRRLKAFGTQSDLRRWAAAGHPGIYQSALDRRTLSVRVQEQRAPRSLIEQTPPIRLTSDPEQLLARFRRLAYAAKSRTDPVARNQAFQRTVDQIAVGRMTRLLIDDQAGNLIRRPTPLTPAIRAGLFRAIALVPNLRVVHGARDRLGRRGLAVITSTTNRLTAIPYKGFGVPAALEGRLIIDPETSEILSDEVISTRSEPEFGLERGEVVRAITFERRRLVPTIRSRPAR